MVSLSFSFRKVVTRRRVRRSFRRCVTGKDPKPATDKNEDSEGDEPPPQKGQEGFRRVIHLHHSSDKSDSSQGKAPTDASPSLVAVLHDTKQGYFWKTLAMKQMLGRWHLQVKLAKMTSYVEKCFSASQSKVSVEPDKYPPANEGMVQMVLAPTMGQIRSILLEQVDILHKS